MKRQVHSSARPHGTRNAAVLVRAFTIIAVLFMSACSVETPPLQRLGADARILAFGDSLTFGTGAKPEQSYPAVLGRMIGRDIVNAGVPGEMSAAGVARLPKLLEQVQPQLVIICHGGNDLLRKRSLADAQRNIEQMIALSRQAEAEVVLIGVPKPGLLLGTADFYADIAARAELPFEEQALAKILSKAALKSDPVHPNANGYEHFANAVHDLLSKAGAL